VKRMIVRALAMVSALDASRMAAPFGFMAGSFRERGTCGDRATATFEDICNRAIST
jgi:hypothetical protein